MYEHRSQPLLPQPHFYRRLIRHLLMALAVMAFCLMIGMIGYHYLESEAWMDAYASAAMILSGMGPLEPLHTEAGKLFAGSYALFSGIVFLSMVGLIIAPIAHRMMHHFHIEESERRKR